MFSQYVQAVAVSAARTQASYLQRGVNTLQQLFRDHFARFAAEYDRRYAKDLGKFRLERISRVATRFLTCGDYRQGVARIRCVNPECRHEYFRPFSCKGFFLCPSCSQKRTLLFAEYLDEQLLLALPHRQFVFTLPKALRVFLRYDQRLFAERYCQFFTLPEQIAAIAYQNKAVLYDMLFRTTAKTLQTIAADPRHLGAEIGFLTVLHTWGQNLLHHPHLHCLVPGGGILADGSQWLACRTGFFLPVRVLSRLFRRLFLKQLQAAFNSGRLSFFSSLQHLEDPQAFAQYLAPLRQSEWVVYAKRPFGGPEQVLAYLRSAEKVTTCFAAANCDRKYAGGLHGKGAKGSKNLAD